MFVLDEARTRDLLSQPESGMGFQFVEFETGDRRRLQGLALNAEYVLTSAEPANLFLQRRQIILAELHAMSRQPSAVVREIRVLSGNRMTDFGHHLRELQASYGSRPGPAKDAKPTTTKVGEIFVRFSAFENDRRINADGSLTPGTYATTEADSIHVHTGKDAVRRYALPNPDPAVHRFTLIPPLSAAIQYGIVEPAYGQPGGGVEVIFPNGTAAGTRRRHDTIPPG